MTRTVEIQDALKRRYSAPEYAIFLEVADATGARHTGFADAIAMSLWPSRGTDLEGFEIKVSRGDWLREKVNPAKAERFAARCDRWWLVTGERVITDETEIPIGWGWMDFHPTKGLVTKRPAPKLDPQPVDRPFLAALFRGAQKFSDELMRKMVADQLASRREQDEAGLEQRIETARGRDKRDADIMATIRAAMKGTATENDLIRWIGDDDMAAAMIAVMRSGTSATYKGLLSAAETLEQAAAKIRASHADLALPVLAEEPKKVRRRLA